MGISLSCPFADYDDLDDDDGRQAVVVKPISLDGEDARTTLRSVSFNGRNSEPTIMKSSGSGKMVLEGSVSFKKSEMETTISITTPSTDMEKNVAGRSVSFKNKNRETAKVFPEPDNCIGKVSPQPSLDSGSPKHEAALRLQKVYKSFRTRRKLADCAVLVEQRWWKLLDFAELKRSSVSFFDIEKHETAISRWSRARTRAAKVGKGLSKDNKAQKLALQHWLEAIDPRHRYGHNLHFYYVKWLHCESRQPFFYWLDIGEGKEVNLVDKCPRSKLQQQCIKYLGPIERKAYEVVVENGKFFYKQTGKVLDTSEGPKDGKWIFVLSTSKNLYVGQKKKGTFQHSSFLAGGATSAAGRLVVQNGVLKAVWPHSGHYRPTEENFQEFMTYLKEHNVDLTDVKRSPTDEEEDSLRKQRSSIGLRENSSEQDLTQEVTDFEAEDINSDDLIQEPTDSAKLVSDSEPEPEESMKTHNLKSKLSNLKIPKRNDLFETSVNQCLLDGPSCNSLSGETSSNGCETAEDLIMPEQDYMVPKRNLFEEDQEKNEDEIIPKESILQRINSKKGTKSYQLGKQLSCKWTTGAGPRIGCLRDYPSELQFRALEQANLSPRSDGCSRAYSSPRSLKGLSPRVSTPTSLWRETTPTIRTNLR
ncbi:PREDICTED: IQ domain-containing protein IQM2-like [Nelumbo nucifera]|uniref:IQ domain-containing protein IQM2-like n=2 Tax=Nelumbo nucifera TaxID=4432 RepID=A0A1U8BHD0_NELNU|nr:PREDICTED: IQ domain-containing protein IQM2-like [Nelumbo nucifera]DAD30128.1 TPA_asm: hypothetical protein HUJ06_031596 [Nelumbo nucifera]